MYLSVEKERHQHQHPVGMRPIYGGIPTACQAWKMLVSTKR